MYACAMGGDSFSEPMPIVNSHVLFIANDLLPALLALTYGCMVVLQGLHSVDFGTASDQTEVTN